MARRRPLTPSIQSQERVEEGKSAGKGGRDRIVSEEIKLRKDLNNSIAEGSFTNASSSIISSYSTPFALVLNASNSEIGMLSSVQSLAGILSQIPGARLTRSMTRKKIWILCTLISRLFLIPLIFIGIFSPAAEIWMLIILLGFVSFFATMRGPAWSSMMGDIVPQGRRGRYFGKRNMILGFAGTVATLSAGIALSFWGFPLIFAAALALSLVAVVFFARMREPELRQERAYHYKPHFSLRDFTYQIRTNRSFAIFTAYITAVNFSVNIAAPFIAVYMLKDMDIGYGWFAVVVATGAAVYMLSQRYWGTRCDRYGNRKILVVSGVLICFVPLGYMLSSNVLHLILLRIYDGFVWGAFDLVVFNYLLASTPSEKRPGFVANHNIVTGIGTVLGALVGAFLVYHFSSGILMLSAIQAVFLTSLLIRLLAASMLQKVSETEVRHDKEVPVRYVFWESVAVGPARGIEHAVINAFRYPYGIKIKGRLGLEGKRKVKITNIKSMGKEKLFADMGVLPIKASRAFRSKNEKEGVREMALRERSPRSNGGSEYLELGIETQSPKTARIVVHSLQRFAETDRVLKSIRAKNVVFVGLKTMKQTSMDDLRQSVAKINRACSECKSSISLVDEEWLVVTPQTASIV